MKKFIGQINVDSGLVYLGDPCYVIGKKNMGKLSWGEFLKSHILDKVKEDDSVTPVDNGEGGDGLVVQSGYGDGTYSVYAKFDREGGIVKSITIDFLNR